MKTRFEYYRIPKRKRLPQKGKPDVKGCHRYYRGDGLGKRWNVFDIEDLGEPTSNGGITTCIIEDDAGQTLSSAIARCSLADNFCYKIGRDIAFGRAMKQLEEKPKKQQTMGDWLTGK